MPLFGKVLLVTGLVIAGVGLVFLFVDKIPFVGRLPGDFHVKKDNFQFYFPLTTSILISVVLSLLFWLIAHFLKK